MLTDTQCRKAVPRDRPFKLTDGKGLYLEVKPNGTKAWRYRYELPQNGKRRENVFAIGDYATVPAGETDEQGAARRNGRRFSLAEARAARDAARGLVRQGIHPSSQRRLARIRREAEAATTFESVAREWLKLRDWEEITKTRRLDMLARVVFPKIGVLPVGQVTAADILDLLKTASDKNGRSVAAEAQRTVSAVFDFAISTLRAESTPVTPVRKALPANKTQHRRALSAEEIGELLRALEGYNRNFQTVAAFRLMWFTLCRPVEAIGARWAEFDLDAAVWRISAERMKMRKEHVSPLSLQAVDLLRKMQSITGELVHVFPNRDDRSKPMTDATMRQALKNLGWSTRYSPHATRATGSTRLNELGYNGDWIERQLAHAEKDAVRRTYNHAQHLDDRRQMMQAWANRMDAWRQRADSMERTC